MASSNDPGIFGSNHRRDAEAQRAEVERADVLALWLFSFRSSEDCL
jgi:hypothetical protein